MAVDATGAPPSREAETATPAAQVAEPEADCDEVYELRAHAPNSDGPFMVPGKSRVQPRVLLDAPWGGEKVQAIRIVPLTDNKAVLRHGSLYAGPGQVLLTGWAPGDEQEVRYPADVGLDLPSGPRSFLLAMNYDNTGARTDRPDRSGVAVCIVKGANLRKYAAGSMMGFYAVPPNTPNRQVAGTCVARTSQPVYLLTATPHAHDFTTHMKFTVKKGDGTEIVMHDMPFRFDKQTSYRLDPPVRIDDGDVVTTSCTFSEQAGVSSPAQGIGDACFNFAVYYPKGALRCGLETGLR